MTPYHESDGVTLYHGDCREILPQLGRFDLLLTDPPYGIGYGGSQSIGGTAGRAKAGWKTWKTGWDEAPVDQELLDCAIRQAKISIVWGGNYFKLPPSQCWFVWDKEQRNFTLADAEMAWTNMDKAIRVFSYSRGLCVAEGPRQHPTQKPVALMRWCLARAEDPQTILDPFAGSGTTLLAAKLEGRKAVGIEISEEYCEIAANRLRQRLLF